MWLESWDNRNFMEHMPETSFLYSRSKIVRQLWQMRRQSWGNGFQERPDFSPHQKCHKPLFNRDTLTVLPSRLVLNHEQEEAIIPRMGTPYISEDGTGILLFHPINCRRQTCVIVYTLPMLKFWNHELEYDMGVLARWLSRDFSRINCPSMSGLGNDANLAQQVTFLCRIFTI